MDVQRLKQFFLYCTIINGVLLIVSIAGCVVAPDWGYDLQSRLFDVPRETINVLIYQFLGLFKVAWLFFNVVPYVVLRIVEGKARSSGLA